MSGLIERVCAGCREGLPDAARFCPSCGEPAPDEACSTCSGRLTPGARFCPSCGAPVGGTPARAPATVTPLHVSERRITSVLFADLVGFTPLAESHDAEDVRELLSRYFAECRTVVGRYGGVIEKFIGDAVMAVWGVPIAHEDDAERAVRAGLELVQAIAGLGDDIAAPDLAMRVGVVTGEVAVTVGATAEGMVTGDAVNTAARVQATAEPGQVWVDETTRSLTAAAISYQDTGDHHLKGKAEPVRLWHARAVVAEVGGGQRVDGLEAPLVGRARELRFLKELFHATEETMRPRLVLVDGVPGVGKSRLAWEFEKYIDGLTTNVRWHRGRCLSYGDGVAFWALAEALRPRLGLVETDAGEVVGQRLEAALAEFVPEAAERTWLRPRLAALMGNGPAGTFAREDLFSAWATFLEHVGGGTQAVVLVINDAQYADDGLLDFLDHLLGTARAGIFVLALARPELLERRPDLGGRRTTVIRLDPLDDVAMAQLVDGLVAGLPEDTRNALVRRADGVPLFAVETVRALIDREAVVQDGGCYVPAEGVTIDLEAIGAPASLQALVAARLDALTPEERRVVADASVLGATFTRAGLDALTGTSVDVDATLASLQRKEILTVQQDRFSAERGQYRFVQGVVRQLAYSTQSKRDRKSRHLAVAGYLSTQLDGVDDLALVTAQHLLDAADESAASDTDVPELIERARALLERAAQRARALGSPADAQRIYEAALWRTDDTTEQARLRTAAAEAAGDAGAFQSCADHASEAVVLFDSLGMPLDSAIAVAVLGRALMAMQDNAAAIELAEPRWQALDGVPGAESALLRLSITLGAAHQFRGEHRQMSHYAERRILLAEAMNDPESLGTAHLQMGVRYIAIGAPLTAAAMYESTARISREHGHWNNLARALNNLATLAVSRDLPMALSLGREGRDAARRSGVVSQIDYTAFNYLLALWMAGQLDEATALLAEAQESVVDPGISLGLRTIEAWLADAHGQPLPQAPSRETSDNESDLAWAANLAIMRASADQEHVVAAELARASIVHVLAASSIDDDFVHLWPPLVEAALSARDAGLAADLLTPVSTAAPGIISTAVSAQFHRLRGLVGAAAGQDPAQVENDLRDGIAALGEFGALGHRARAEEELAGWLVGQGRSAEATPLIDGARDAYAAMGATGWAARLDAWQLDVTAVPS